MNRERAGRGRQSGNKTAVAVCVCAFKTFKSVLTIFSQPQNLVFYFDSLIRKISRLKKSADLINMLELDRNVGDLVTLDTYEAILTRIRCSIYSKAKYGVKQPA